MAPNLIKACLFGLASGSCVLAKPTTAGCPGLTVSHEGTPAGTFKNISGIQIYHTHPPRSAKPGKINTAILYVTDIFGAADLQNKLLADSIARANYAVIMPDLFSGNPVPANALSDPTFNFPAWLARHPVSESDNAIATTIAYMRNELGVQKIGAAGYCWGGKYVPRFLAAGQGIDVGFIAHPSNLATDEIMGIKGPISIAAGDLDDAFNATSRRTAEDILFSKNTTYQTSLYAGAPHGFGTRVDLSNTRQKFAKEAAFLQAVTWFDAWL
ncbi:alpha/beta-hydrolase [Amniculicola lignicola CBS 123094]|uniref:Alpha/beta-hydrolase n=1 Tax=Amniculicola lignicola CBS 123094 TaxID=1392246 RepID=A0A6A5W0Z0_9PLEO|nr:alpha/beta-hydrolase [Amniculicola lignicola CBS 123094]